MKNSTKNLILAAFICLAFFFIFLIIKEVRKPLQTVGVLITKVDTVRVEEKSVPYMITERKPNIFISRLPFAINSYNSSDYMKKIALLSKEIDSLHIEIKTIRTFSDSLLLDSVGLKVTVKDSVTENKITSRLWVVDYTKKTITEQTKERLKWCSISPGVYLIDRTPGLSIGADIFIKRHILGVNFGMDIENRTLFSLKYSLFPF